MAFSTILRGEADPIWYQILVHPFLVEMGEGLLQTDKFRYYVQQDYLFLIEFARCLGIASAKAEDKDRMRDFASLLNASLTIELEMLEVLGEKLGITSDKLRSTISSPTTLAYTRHLLYIAFAGTVGELMTAMLPCMWLYQEIGEMLNEATGISSRSLYSKWCATYVSKSYVKLVNWYRGLVDNYALESSPSMKKRMKQHFLTSSQYEYLFWNMAYHKEGWPFKIKITYRLPNS